MDVRSARARFGIDSAVALVFTVFCLVVTNHIPPETANVTTLGSRHTSSRRRAVATPATAVRGAPRRDRRARHLYGGELRRRAGYIAPLVPAVPIAQQGDRRRTWTAVVATIGLLLPFALIARTRAQTSSTPRLRRVGRRSGVPRHGPLFSRRAYLAGSSSGRIPGDSRGGGSTAPRGRRAPPDSARPPRT